ncbi:hypothetical protein [Lyngbya sp. PCC 8106]|uniref:hypothetical protein n=1 Tax=Lyngbya sp. (strain PCC 8106) TaxID=313612 RepID=UPI0000EA970F|nr:hypothetical protein [Lyngbya sp. PCC 8106]EAW35686.1 hypothetical protein L8106_08456 [Lyngbya sp. PCC 8106]
MRFIKGIFGILAYGSAAFFLLSAIVVLFDSDSDLASNFFVCLICLVITAGFAKLGQWLMKKPPLSGEANQQVKSEEQTGTKDLQSTLDLQSIFYKLVEKNQGSITVMQFAIAAGISGEDSKAYLEQQAKQFEAHFDVSETGTIVYKFPL